MSDPQQSASTRRPAVLIVRDGWGRNPNAEHDAFNAVKLADTPRCDALLRDYPWTLIKTSGEDVGLPDGTMGNSEVGHQNIGAGRVVDQESVRISKAARAGQFIENQVLYEGVERAKATGRTVHLLGLASDAGVHALLDHLYACLDLCRKVGHDKVALHLFTDGRDTGPFTGKDFIEQVEAKCAEIGVGQVASICGRYYAMDRDNRWERVQRAYACLTGFNARQLDLPWAASAGEAVQQYYDNPTTDSQKGDEFITPTLVGGGSIEGALASRVTDGDTVIFYNYRGDRPREIVRAFVMPTFEGEVPPSPDTGNKCFDRGPKLNLHFVTMTAYETALGEWVHVAYPKPPKMKDIMGRFLASRGLKQFRCAETEKFPHVTFFFNDYRDDPFDGETREMAQSPKVATYDLQPEMSAEQVTNLVLGRIEAGEDDFILVNFANGDMVGHTGSLEAAVKAVETVDGCVGRIVDATLARGGVLIVTADHGNAEQMFDPDTNAPHTAHTTYDVECILVDGSLRQHATGDPRKASDALNTDGRLADACPTILKMMGLEPPEAMTGRPLY